MYVSGYLKPALLYYCSRGHTTKKIVKVPLMPGEVITKISAAEKMRVIFLS